MPNLKVQPIEKNGYERAAVISLPTAGLAPLPLQDFVEDMGTRHKVGTSESQHLLDFVWTDVLVARDILRRLGKPPPSSGVPCV